MANEFIIRKGYKSLAASEITGSLTTTGNIVGKASGYLQRLYIQDKKALDSSSNFLYIDPNTEFGSGIYINNAVRIDGGLLGSYNEDLQLRTGTTTRITIANADGAVRFHNYGAGYLKTDSSGNITVDTSTIEDTLQTVTDRGASSNNIITLTRNAEQLRMNSADANGPFASFKKNGTNIGFIGSGYHLWSSPNNNSSNIGFRGENQIDFGIGASVKMTINSSGNTTFAGNVNIGANQAGKNLYVYGVGNGEGMFWDAAQSHLTIKHDDGDLGLEIYPVSSTTPSAIQLKVGRDAGQYWGVYTTDRDTFLIHRQDETDGQMRTNFDQWDSNTTDPSGEWRWRSGNGSGGSMTTALTLNKGGDATFAGSVTVAGTLTAQEFHTEFVSASILYESGSTKFGDTSDDIHSISGSLRVTGSGAHYFTDGNVGIGTTSPNQLLHVDGNLRIGPYYSDNDRDGFLLTPGGVLNTIQANNENTNFDNNQGNIHIRTGNNSSASPTERISVLSTGNVGIGTTSPSKKLTVYGGNDNGIWVDSSGSQYTSIAWGNNGTEKANIAYDNTNANFVLSAYGASDTVFSNNGSERMRIDSAGNATFAGLVQVNRDSADNPASTSANLYLVDTRSLAANTGGAIVFSSYYQGTSAVSGGSYIKGYKENATSGDYGYGLKFGVRENGQSTGGPCLTLNSAGNATFSGKIETNSGPNRFTHQQNAGSRLELYNNRQDASNVEVYRIAAYNSGEVTGVHFYRGGGSQSGYTKIFAKKNNASNLEEVVQFGTNDSLTTTFAGDVDITRSSTGQILSRVYNSNTSGTGTSVLRIANGGNQANGARLEFSDLNYYNATVSVDRTNGMRFMVHDDSTSMSDLLTHTALTLATNKNATFAGTVTAPNFVLTGTDGFNLPSGGFLDWANGDARIVEGLVNNYSLSFQTWDGSALNTALRLDGNNIATFAGSITGTSAQFIDTTNPDGGGGAGEGGSLTVEGRRDGTANLISLRARDASAPTAALPNGQGGLIRWQGFDGTDFAQMGAISVVADGQAVANSDAPSKMIFYTTPDGSDALTTALTLDKSQNATFAGTVTANGITLTGDQTLPTDFVSAANGGTFLGGLTITHDDGLFLKTTTNGGVSQIKFSDNSTSNAYGQIGHIKYQHSNGASYGSGESFIIGGTETSMTILADGKLMYNEGIYSKPASGTGAGTRKDANWDAAYAHSQATHAPTDAEANVQADWNETTTTSDAFIQNKPTISTDFVSAANGGTFADSINVHGNILLTGAATTTNQDRTIDFTGFDKEGTTDFSDRAYIRHTTNTGGHAGSVLVISSQNDSGDGIAFLTNGSSQLKHNSNVIWTAGNDGASSGLDADLLDGQHASAFLTSYTETDTLASVTGRGSETTTSVRFKNDLNYFGLATTNNEGEIIINTGNAGSPQIGFTEHGDASWAIGIDDDDNSFKIHGTANATIPTINGLGSPLFEITTGGDVIATGDLTVNGGNIAVNNNNGGIQFSDVSSYWLRTATNWGIYWNTSSNQLQFHGSGNSRAFIDLDTGRIQGNEHGIFANNVYAGGTEGFVFGSSTSEGEYIQRSGNDIKFVAGGNTRMTVDGDAGYVGIGTTSPGAPLTVEGSGSTILDIQGSQGQLFSVTDDLTGDIFSVSDISGVPILNVNATGDSYFDGNLDISGSLKVGDGTADTTIEVKKADNNVADQIKIFNGTTRVGEIGTQDNDWLRINQHTTNNIYTPRYFRADGGLFVINTNYGINSSGTLLNASLSGTYTNTLTLSTVTINTPVVGTSNKIKFANNDYIRYDDSVGVGRFHFDADGGTNNASVQAATFVGALTGNASTATSAGEWTTARTITIGSTGKTLDGSGDVSWTLAEIGALGSTAKAADSELIDGIDSSRIVYGSGANKISSATDMNSRSNPSGFFEGYNISNSPTTGTWYNFINIRHSNGNNSHGFQIAATYYDENIWTRTYQGGNSSTDGTYTTWRRLFHEGHKPTWSEIDSKPSTFAPSAHNHDDRYYTETESDGRFTPKDHIVSLGSQAFTGTATTAGLIAEMDSDGAFDSYSSVFKTSWSYAGNFDLSDAGRFVETAGASFLTWTDNSSDTVRGNITILAIAPNTGGSAGKMFVYNDQGGSYSPGWREIWTNTSDGAGSGLDADLLDGVQGSSYLRSDTSDTFTGTLTMAGTLALGNNSITGVGHIVINDPGVNEGIQWTGGNNWYIQECPDNMTNASGNLQFSTGTTRRVTITTGGSLNATADVIAYSDERVKTNIKTIDNALEKVCNLRGVNYNRTDLEDKSDKIGVIAQEVEKVLPEVVQYSEDADVYSVAYGNMAGVFIEAIKEQQKQIEELKAIVNKLQNEK